jgi:hypothetical protein
MIHSFTASFGTYFLTGIATSVPLSETFSLIETHSSVSNINFNIWNALHYRGICGSVYTDKIGERSLSSKFPVDMKSTFMKFYVT